MGKLIRIELFDFKSYKGHQSIEFGDSYFTSIIGPNGSGKSNSMDAISFVLGIKSSQLRSSHLRDLVYRGRVLKRSKIAGTAGDAGDEEDLGADASVSQTDPKTAWVMAVYEDDDGNEQHWKRSINSQGSSEYRINNRLCTAQEYNDALEKENILIKARNFLVFQGDVETVASQSPKELTKLIEQISGSLEYKAEYERLKLDQERAAELSHENLHRRRGINAEIKQYQEQKREAENYEKKSGERDQAIVTHLLWKLYHSQQIIEDNKRKIETQQAEMREFRRLYEREDARYDQAKKDQAKATRVVAKQDREIKLKEKSIEEKETSLVPVDEKIKIAGKNAKVFETRITDITRDRDSQSNTVTRLQNELETVSDAQAQFDQEQSEAAAGTGAVLSARDQTEYSRLREQVNTRSSAPNIKIDNFNRQLKTESEAADAIRSKVTGYQREQSRLESETADLTERFNQLNNQVQTMTQEMTSKKRELKQTSDNRLKTQQTRAKLQEKLQDTLRSIMEIDDGRRQNDRDVRMRETLAALKRIFPGVKGRVSELCKPKLKKYQDAVSTVLGRHFDAVVVDNEKTAKDCIEYLRDQRAGQATFIPLDTIQVKPTDSNLKGMHRGMRLAIDTVEYEKGLERAMQYACGNAVVCDDIGVAKYICYEKGVEVKAVTLDGTVIHKAGMMTGGRVDKRNQRRWEESEVENFKKIRDTTVAELATLPDPSRRPQEELLEAELGRLEQRLQYSTQERDSIQRNLEDARNGLQHAIQQISELQPQLDQADQTLTTLQNQLEQQQSLVHDVEDEVFAAFCRRLNFVNIRWYEERQGSLQAAAAQKRLEFSTQITRLQNQLQYETGRLNDTTRRIEKLQEQMEKSQEVVEQMEQEKAVITDELENLQQELDLLKTELNEKQSDLEAQSEQVAALKREVSKRNKDLENTAKTISQLEGEIERMSTNKYALLRRCKLEEIDIPLTADSAPLDNLPIEDAIMQQVDPDAMDVDEDPSGTSNEIREIQDFGIEVDYEDLDDELKENGEEKLEEELLDKIKALDNELEKMAPNMKAIERLEGVENRLQETEQEFEDSRRQAKTARDNFLAVKQKRTDLFNKAFSHISDQISKVYKDLTKSSTFPLGGTAYLDVEDNDEPYLDGIKYHAMPPMKRFRDMEHLSGGEKTMAALALLFAVHSYQASPFFVLDEVDAALDNANVQKIANYIRENSGPGFQFIVISLKTGLFQQSETLVGIYRDQVDNSSKALTLDLRKYVDA